MDITNLKDTLRSCIVNNNFLLDVQRLNSLTINALSAIFFSNNCINLTVNPDDALEDPQDGIRILVRGQGVDYPFTGLQTTITFQIVNSNVELELMAEADANWNLVAALPLFEGTLIEDLRFATGESPVFYLRSYQNDSEQPGLYFRGNIDLAAMTNGWATLFGKETQSISGKIDLVENGTKFNNFNLTAQVSESIDLRLVQFKNLKLTIGSNLEPDETDTTGETYFAAPFIKFEAQIPFQAQNTNYTLPVAATMYSMYSEVKFETDLNTLINIALEELKCLTNDIGLESVLPTVNFNLEEILKFNKFNFIYNLSSNQVTSIELGVGMANSWTIMQNQITKKDVTITGLQLDFKLTDPFGAKTLDLDITGTMNLADQAVVEIHTGYPNWHVYGYLQAESTLKIKEVINELLGAGTTLPDLGIDFFNFGLAKGCYQISLLSQSLWSMNIGQQSIELDNISIFSQYQSGIGTSSSFSGDVCIAGLDFHVDAEYATDEGWQFSGKSVSASLNVGELFGKIVAEIDSDFEYSHIPASIQNLIINEVGIEFNTGDNSYSFSCAIQETLGGVDYEITVNVVSDGNGQSPGVCASIKPVNAVNVNLKQLIRELLGEEISCLEELTLKFNDAFFLYVPAATPAFLMGLELAAAFSLTEIPLVDTSLPEELSVSVDNMRLVIASRDLTSGEVKGKINPVLAAQKINQLPDGSADPATQDDTVVISSGVNFMVHLKAGDTSQIIDLKPGGAAVSNPVTTGVGETAGGDAASENIKWITLKKSAGPLYFEKVGLQYQDAGLYLLVDASLSTGCLKLIFDGLKLGSPLSEFRPAISLKGLGIEAGLGAVDIGGYLVENAGSYDGYALVKTEKFSLPAIGSYSNTTGKPSLFVYGVLNYPLGGPGFFYVTGLAAGFGYNRHLNLPTLADIKAFPLVRAAVNSDVATSIANIHTYITPVTGENFFAAGVKFTTFKIIDSFALLTLSTGKTDQVNFIGTSTLTAPPQLASDTNTALAKVEIGYLGSYLPDQGELLVRGQIMPGSYFISKDCHLSGGFAFASWFAGEHAGDFVFTVGGYHPKFTKPAHYPDVPRLSFNWQVDSNLLIKGDAYYALTPFAYMAGAQIAATWKSGPLEAWFKAAMDFLIAWRPFHYQAELHVDVGGSYTFKFFGTRHLTFDVGADLEIWGPEFSGKAHVHLSVISFTVAWGSDAARTPEAIGWNDFRHSFLPQNAEREEVCSISVKSGLVKKIGDIYVINPKELVLATNSQIPVNRLLCGGTEKPDVISAECKEFGIGPMGIKYGENLDTAHELTITHNKTAIDQTPQFSYTAITKKMPVALWDPQGKITPQLNRTDSLVEVVTGFEIRPVGDVSCGGTKTFNEENLSYETEPISAAFAWNTMSSFTAEPAVDVAEVVAIVKTNLGTAGKEVLRTVGYDIEANPGLIDLNYLTETSFVDQPLVYPMSENAA